MLRSQFAATARPRAEPRNPTTMAAARGGRRSFTRGSCHANVVATQRVRASVTDAENSAMSPVASRIHRASCACLVAVAMVEAAKPPRAASDVSCWVEPGAKNPAGNSHRNSRKASAPASRGPPATRSWSAAVKTKRTAGNLCRAASTRSKASPRCLRAHAALACSRRFHLDET
jgi:hypothetical protein